MLSEERNESSGGTSPGFQAFGRQGKGDGFAAVACPQAPRQGSG